MYILPSVVVFLVDMSEPKKAKLDLEAIRKEGHITNGTEKNDRNKHSPKSNSSSFSNGIDLSKDEILKMRKAYIG